MVTPHTRFCPHAKKKLKPPCKLHHVLWQLKGFKYRFQAALETSEKLKDKKKKKGKNLPQLFPYPPRTFVL